jgi:hypothetical protein
MTSKAFGLAQLGNAFADGALSNRNKIINGAMTIDQRNAGAAVTNIGPIYTVDRWTWFAQSGSGHNIQQVSDAPVGFDNSLRVTIGTGAAPSAAHQNIVWQPIEGFNVADLNFGAVGAATVTFSFWAKSSIAGTYNVWIQNTGSARSYVSTYTINAPNTWEKKSVTFAGDTTGTWLKTNGVGLFAGFSFGCGSNFNGTANTWASGNVKSTLGATNLIATNGATWQVTGVQLEAGDTATPFEHRSYGQELALCQRYFEKSYDLETVAGAANENGMAITWAASVSNYYSFSTKFLVSKRATPTVTIYNPSSGTTSEMRNTDNGGAVTVAGISNVGQTAPFGFLYSSSAVSADGNRYSTQWTASAEL